MNSINDLTNRALEDEPIDPDEIELIIQRAYLQGVVDTKECDEDSADGYRRFRSKARTVGGSFPFGRFQW